MTAVEIVFLALFVFAGGIGLVQMNADSGDDGWGF